MRWRSFGPIAIALGVAGCALDRGGDQLDDLEAGAPSYDATADGGHANLDADGLIDAGAAPDAPSDPSDAGIVDTGVSPTDGSPLSNDAQPPDAAVDAGLCPGVMCNGVCLATATDCTTCTAGPLLCANTKSCVGDCASCTATGTGTGANASRPIECYKCDANRQNPIGTCEPRDSTSYCLNVAGYGTALHCACGPMIPCPGRTQVCTDIGVAQTVCATCGESVSDLKACQGGGTCSQIKQTCD